jgi:hypothetical protein
VHTDEHHQVDVAFFCALVLCWVDCGRTDQPASGEGTAALIVFQEHWQQQWSCEIMPFGISQHPPEKFTRQSSVITGTILHMRT